MPCLQQPLAGEHRIRMGDLAAEELDREAHRGEGSAVRGRP
jgi:hypothetical protein